jgi:hypothetical protein
LIHVLNLIEKEDAYEKEEWLSFDVV